ncbi:S-layer homology domain-containing protein [Paenibacillus sp. JSM ZJ436]|uniref:S-layer homology domain-containing protein n=1 Tax=Paenibacillus sp. JSM ZJ436 TaxID=3376190 RepID=UPI0037AF9EEE
MTLRKKITVSTLAVSMVAATIAGFPLGSDAFSKYAGGAVVSAADYNLDYVKDRLNRVYGQLSESDKNQLRALRDEVKNKISFIAFEQDFAPLLSASRSAGVLDSTLFNLFHDLTSLTFDPQYDNLVAIRTNQEYIDAAKQIGQAGGVPNLTVDDIGSFLFGPGGVERQLVSTLQNKSMVELVNLLNNSETRNNLIRDSFRSVLNNPVSDQSFAQVLSNLGITENDIAASVSGVQSRLDSAVVKDAALALAIAYLAAENINLPGEPDPGNPTDPVTPPPTDGGGNSGGGGGGAPGGAPGGGAVPTPTPDGPLEDLLEFDASKSVQVEAGQAVVKLDNASVLKLIGAIKAKAGAQDQLKLTLDLGSVDYESLEVPLSADIVKAANEAGIKTIEIAVNGLTVSLPIQQFSSALSLQVAKKADTAVTVITNLTLASDVYEFGLEVNGKQVTSFRQPIIIALPLRDVNVDQELLSVVKIVGNQLQIQGGVVNGDVIVEPRDTFSSYAVVENKVSFSDIGSVQSWAGRQIQVVAAKGAIDGRPNGLFAPKDSVTRAEFSKMLVRALNLENSLASEPFTDVYTGDWFAPYVAAAAEKGIIQGRSSTTFAPHAKITRAEMAVMISRALKVSQDLGNEAAMESILNQFSDAADIHPTLTQGVAFAASKGLVIGNSGKFNPNDNATRAEAAVMIYRTMNSK